NGHPLPQTPSPARLGMTRLNQTARVSLKTVSPCGFTPQPHILERGHKIGHNHETYCKKTPYSGGGKGAGSSVGTEFNAGAGRGNLFPPFPRAAGKYHQSRESTIMTRICALCSVVGPKVCRDNFRRSGAISSDVLLGNPRAELNRN